MPTSRSASPLRRTLAGLAFLTFLSSVTTSGCEKPSTSPAPKELASASAESEDPPSGELPSADKAEWDPSPSNEEKRVRPAIDGSPSPATFSEGSSKEFRSAFQTLSTFVEKHSGHLSVAAIDLESETWLVRSRETEPVNPASNAKLLTAAAALELLGTDYQFSTSLYGAQDDAGHVPLLVLEGGGAPDLETADLYRLVRVAKGQNMKTVADIIVDQSRFSDRFVPPAFEQQPEEWAPFRAPISALALNRNSVTLNVVPQAPGAEALVWYDPPDVVTPAGRIVTSEAGKGDRVTWTLAQRQGASELRSTVGGSLARDAGRHRYARRLDDPRLAGGLALRALLLEAGIAVQGEVRLGKRKKEPRIAAWNSAPIAELVRDLGKDSDNFVAEMLLVALSAAEKEEVAKSATSGKDPVEASRPWSSERGAAVLTEWLKSIGLSLKGVSIKNGSGLFDSNRVTVELLARLLAHVENNPRIYQEFVSQLATGATDGTLERRMRGDPLAGRVRAKTGTIRDVDALSGYIQRADGRPPVAFSVVVTGVKVSHADIRNQIDRMILAWAHGLPEPKTP